MIDFRLLVNKLPNHLLVAASSLISKLISAGIQIVSIKFLIEILGEDRYAVFALLSGLLVWGGLSDLGIGYSLQNYISECRANKNPYNSYIVTALYMVLLSLFVFLLFLWFSSGAISNFYFSSFSSDVIGNGRFLFFIAGVVFCCIGCGSIINKIWFAEQCGWKSNIINAFSYCIGFLFIIIIYFFKFSVSIQFLLTAFFMPLGVVSLLFIAVRLKDLYSHYTVSYFHIRVLSKRASGFFVFSFLATVVLQADFIVISQKLSAKEIVVYSVLMKLFGLVFFVYTALLQALWPLCAEFGVKMKWSHLNSLIFKNILLGSLFVIICTIFACIFKVEILGLVSNKIDSNIGWDVFLMFGIYFIIRVWSDTFAMLLQSMNHLLPLWMFVPIQAILSLSMQWIFAERYGIKGILIGLILSFMCTVFWGLPVMYFKKIKNTINKKA